MNGMRIAGIASAAAALGGGLWFYQRAEAREGPAYRTAAVERADLQSTVSATGALSAVRTVQVGTQVSGQVSAIHVDFNDKVRKGQLLARIDPTLQRQAVAEAQAGVARATAQLALARAEHERNRTLHDQKIVTDAEYNSAQSNLAVAQANARSAEIALSRARQNLAYTAIYAPIDGVVVERNVDVGQTVAASLSAPQLFLIANDLTEMQILASVDESDIGRIQEGQPVTFSVQSYAGEQFSGTVKQVRLQSATTENVVNYTAVVSVKNASARLLPGMTATVKFVTSAAPGVLTVPNAALRFRPAGDAAAAVTGTRPAAVTGAAGAPRAGSATRTASATLYTVDAAGRLSAHRVRTGLTDGQRTEVSAPGIDAGTQVVVGTSGGDTGAQPAAGTTRSPFQQQPQQGGPPRPPGVF